MRLRKLFDVSGSSAACLAVAALAGAQPAPFNAFLLPATTAIDTGDTARVRFEVDATARQFNGYEITIRYRPDVVDFLPPVVEGPLMLDACGNTFRFLTQTDSTLTYTHVILCAGVALDGPGLLSTYAFRGDADGVSPVVITSDPNCAFFDAGECVNPSHPTFPRQVVLHHAQIVVGPPGGIDPAGASPPLAQLRLEPNVPNPFAAGTSIGFELGAGGPVSLEVFGPAGRRVWSQRAVLAAGRHRMLWNGAALDASPLPSGAYFLRLTTPAGSQSRRLTLLR